MALLPWEGWSALKAVALAGGATSTLCRLDGQSRGATWGEDGQVISQLEPRNRAAAGRSYGWDARGADHARCSER